MRTRMNENEDDEDEDDENEDDETNNHQAIAVIALLSQDSWPVVLL